MGELKRVGIIGIGSYVPEKVMTNDDMSKIVETSNEWIVSRTGIEERRISTPEQATSDLAFEAAKKSFSKCKSSSRRVGSYYSGYNDT